MGDTGGSDGVDAGDDASGKVPGAMLRAPWGGQNRPLLCGSWAQLRSGWRRITGRH